MIFWKENDIESSCTTRNFEVGRHIHKVWLGVHEPPATTICPSTRTLEFSAFCGEVRCICISTLDEDLSHSLEVSSFLVSIWKIERLCIPIGQLCIHHTNLFLQRFSVSTKDCFSGIIFCRNGHPMSLRGSSAFF